MSRNSLTFDATVATLLARKVSRGFSLIAYFSAALLLVALIWACVAKVDVTAKASAVLKPVDGFVKVQSRIQGAVAIVNVREGQHVSAGDLLFRLEKQEMDSALSQALAKHRSLEQKRRDLMLERERLEARAELVKAAKQQEILAAELALRNSQREHERSVATTNAAVRSCKARLDKLEDRCKRARKLAPTGAVTPAELSEARADLEAARAEYDKALAETNMRSMTVELARQKLAVAKENARLSTAEAEHAVGENQQRLTELNGEIEGVAEEIERFEYQLAQCDIRASVSGIVVGVRAKHAGEVVKPGQILASISPDGAELEAEVHMPNRHVAFIRPGQIARLRLSALPHGRYGQLPGRVTKVGEDLLRGKDGKPVFPVHCRLAHQLVHVRGRTLKLRAGMTAEVSIVTHRQSPFSLLTAKLGARSRNTIACVKE